MNLTYISDNKVYRLSDGKAVEIPCRKIDRYKETLAGMQRRNEWKTSGTGAAFTGAADYAAARYNAPVSASVTGIGEADGKLLYSVLLEDVGWIYRRRYDPADETEELVYSSKDFCFGEFDCKNGKAALSMGSSLSSLHIAVMDVCTGSYTEYTDGDSIEEHPSWSADGSGIYFSTAGYARNENGVITAMGPHSIAYLDLGTKSMSDEISSDDYDYLHPGTDADGSLYYIRQPYRSKTRVDITPMDILLFPYRIIKGIFGFLNIFATLFGGEALKGGGGKDTRTKNRSEKDILIEGNIINADKLARENEKKGEKFAGIMPLNRVLVRRSKDGTEDILKKGVLDYCICNDGTIIISNGSHITALAPDGSETHLAKAKLATRLFINNTERSM